MAMHTVYAHIGFILKLTNNGYKIKYTLKEMTTSDTKNGGFIHQTWWGTYAPDLQAKFKQIDASIHSYLTNDNSF